MKYGDFSLYLQEKDDVAPWDRCDHFHTYAPITPVIETGWLEMSLSERNVTQVIDGSDT